MSPLHSHIYVRLNLITSCLHTTDATIHNPKHCFTLNVFPITHVLNGSRLSIQSTNKATKCAGISKSGIKNPSVKTPLGSVLPLLLTKGEGLVNLFQTQGKETPPGITLGSAGNKARVSREGKLRGVRAAFWYSFPQLPTCTQPNRGQDYTSHNSTGLPFPLHTRQLEPDPKGNP